MNRKTFPLSRIAIELAALSGCTCDPDIEAGPDPECDGVTLVRVAHDRWCPLLLARSARFN